MDTVVNKNNKRIIYSVYQYLGMTEQQRDDISELIVCEECGGPAHFRRKSRDGKKACFCAKHLDSCVIGNPKNKKTDTVDEEVQSIEIDDSEFQVIWNYDVKKQKKSSENKDEDNSNDEEQIRKAKRHVIKPSLTRKAKISMSQILKYAEYGILKEQGIEVKIGDDRYPLDTVVKRFGDSTSLRVGKPYFLWGGVRYIKDKYINIESNLNVAVIIDDEILEKFNSVHKYKILKNKDQLLILCFGTFIRKKGRFYLLLNDTKHLYYRKRKLP